MRPINDAPMNRYVLVYYGRGNWHDSQDDPNFKVAKLVEKERYIGGPRYKEWVEFGPGSIAFEDVTGWWPLPGKETK